MKTLPLVLGAALLVAPALAHAQEAATPVAAPLAPVAQWMAPPGYVLTIQTQRRSVNLMVGGIVLAALSAAPLIGGSALLASSASREEGCGSQCGLGNIGIALDRGAGLFFTISGGLMLAGGITMAVVGGAQVPVGPRPSGRRPLVPAVAVGAGNATMRWSF